MDDSECKSVVKIEGTVAERVNISRNEQCDLIIHPLPVKRGEALFGALRAPKDADDAFIATLEEYQAFNSPMQDRESL